MTIDGSLLDADETLIWSGQPRAIPYAFKKSWQLFLFGLLFFGFSVFWVHGAARQSSDASGPFWMFGIPFVIVGAGMVLSPLWHLFRGLRTTYVLTNRRALTVSPPPFARRLSVPLSRIGFVDTRPSVTGSGDIYFKETVTTDSDGSTVRRDGFLAIPDVVQVEQMLRKAVERTAARSGGGAP
jgi:hypothetical protein